MTLLVGPIRVRQPTQNLSAPNSTSEGSGYSHRELFGLGTIATIGPMGDRSTTWALVLFVVAAVLALILFQLDDVDLVAADSTPNEIVFVQDGSRLVVAQTTDPASEPRLIWEQEQASTAGPDLFIESVEPVNPAVVFAGICCEPTAGRQLLIDIATGRVEFFPINLRFPAVREDRNRVISGGLSIRTDDLGSLLAYENGVGVVPPGDTLRDDIEGLTPRPILLPDDRAAFVDGDMLVLTDLAGDVIAESPVEGVRVLRFDASNQVVVALADSSEIDDSNAAVEDDVVAGDTLYVLSTDTLRPIQDWRLGRPASSIDVLDGWLLFSFTDGSISAARINDPLSPIDLFNRGSAASWLD